MTPILLRPLLGLAALATLPAAARAAEPKTEATKTHVLFMGTDLAVQREKKYYQVENVVGSEFKIRIGQREFYVPTRNRSTHLKVNSNLKLAGTSVTLAGLQSGPAYTPANDPRRKFAARTGAGGAGLAAREVSGARFDEATNSVEKATAAGASPEFIKNYQDIADQESANLITLNQQINSDYGSVPAMANELALELAEGNYDAMEVTFKVSSPEALEDPYMVILFRYRERDAKPENIGMVIHAQTLDPIDANPKLVRVLEGGLPRGYKYLDCEVHIYNRGVEVATNKSAKRVELTRDEAQEYFVVEHMGANKGASVPASAMPGTLPRARRQQLSLNQLNRTIYAKVSKDGALLGAYADEECSLQLDDAGSLAVLGEIFFRPALDKGKPVAGTARVRLGDI